MNFAIAHAQKKILMHIRIGQICVPLKQKKTDLSIEISSKINFEFIKFVKIVNYLPLTKQIGNIKCLVIFDLSRFSIILFCQIT